LGLRPQIWLVALLCLNLTTGCLEIREEIVFKKNFSGQLSYTLDLSRLKELFSMLGGGTQSTEAGGLVAGMSIGLKAQADKLQSIPGISRVSFSGSEKDLVYRLTFRFRNLDALNRALSEYNQAANGTRFELSADRKTLTKYVGVPATGKFQEFKEQIEQSDSSRQMFGMMKLFMKDAQFISSWKFAKPVAGQALDLGSAKLSNKSFTASLPLLGILETEKEVKISATLR
jgi:hypothetical protein